jgi:hypothetical protein
LDLRNYLLMANGVAALSLLLLALAPLSPENRWLLIGLCYQPLRQIALGDVIVAERLCGFGTS